MPYSTEYRPELILATTDGLGPAGIESLIEKFGSADIVCTQTAAALGNAGLNSAVAEAIAQPDEARLSNAARWLDDDRHWLVMKDDAFYPSLLAEVARAPRHLFVAGDPEIISLPQIAIVGSRNATQGGIDNAHQFGTALASAGLTICSGLAEGIDAAAHQAALDADRPTVAVCGTGPDRIYPRKNEALARSIYENGALVSEFAPGTGVHKSNFPRRNRIISGLSLGTLLVEAGSRSGAIITARYAMEQGREVFAIPGSIHSPQSKGCHQLIRNGAKLVETSAHILEELASLAYASISDINSVDRPVSAENLPTTAPDPSHSELMLAMGWDPVSIDTLVSQTGLTADEVSSMLLIMELEDQVELLAGGLYQKRNIS